MTRKTETVAHLDTSIKRWKTRLKRAITMIDKLERKRKRMQGRAITETGVEFNIPLKGIKKPAKLADKVVVFEPEPMVKVTSHPVTNPDNVKLTFEPVTDTDIPEFLRRGAAAQKAAEVAADVALLDHLAAEEIKAKAAETKAAKARGRIATMKAKKSGETKKMPLSGKAALDAIRNG